MDDTELVSRAMRALRLRQAGKPLSAAQRAQRVAAAQRPRKRQAGGKSGGAGSKH